MADLVIAVGPPGKKKPGASGRDPVDSAFEDYMKSKGKGSTESDEGDSPDAADEAGKEGAQAFLDAKDKDAVWDAFKKMYRAACSMGDMDKDEEPDEDDEKDSAAEE